MIKIARTSIAIASTVPASLASIALVTLVLFGCGKGVEPLGDKAPQAGVQQIIVTDTLTVQVGNPPRDSTFIRQRVEIHDTELQLLQDTLGIWRDALASEYSDSLGVWSYGLPFADMPAGFRSFWRYCASCHSDNGKSDLGQEARASLTINTWAEALAYGPTRLVLAARSGGMPPYPAPGVPEDILGRALNYLAHAGKPLPPEDRLIKGFQWAPAETFIRDHCSDCHHPQGGHPLQPKATLALQLDTYSEWRRHQEGIAFRLDPSLPALYRMPPDTLPAEKHPDAEEMAAILEWMERDSPNTIDGSGQGIPLPIGGVVTEGAMEGLNYAEAAALINRSCADCHTEGGLNPDQPAAWTFALRLDRYQSWVRAGTSTLLERLDPSIAKPEEQMPPADFPNQLTLVERQLLIDWLNRGSPNTPNGL
jgi:mono/diheme cytochrome c family protein